MSRLKNYKVIFFAPTDVAQSVAQSMFEAGAGKIGNYDSCCFVSKGMGQFRALEGSDPYIGRQDSIEFVEESKVEMICPQEVLEQTIQAMREAHPYEEPAFDVIELINV